MFVGLHFIGLLTLQLITLIGAFFFKAHVEKNQLSKTYRRAASAILITVHVLILLTIVHAVVFHLMHGCHMGNHACMRLMKH